MRLSVGERERKYSEREKEMLNERDRERERETLSEREREVSKYLISHMIQILK